MLRYVLPLALFMPAPYAYAQDVAGTTTQYPAEFFASYRPTTALDMVRRVPGFVYDPGNPELRGLIASAGNVVIDGRRPAEKTASLDDVLQRIAASSIERIEVIRGEGSGIDMRGQPVVANVVLRAGSGLSSAVTVSMGSYIDGRLAPGASADLTRALGGDRSLSISAGASRYVETAKGDGLRLRSNGSGAIIERARIDSNAGGTTAHLRSALSGPALDGRLQITGSAQWTDYRNHQLDKVIGAGARTTILDEDLGGLFGGQFDAELGTDWKRIWRDGLDSETTLLARIGRKNFISDLDAPGGATHFSERGHSAELLARTTVHARLGPDLNLQFDGEVARNRLVTATQLDFAGFPIPLPNAHATIVETRFDLGNQVNWKPGERIDLRLGLHREQARIRAVAGDTFSATYPYWRPTAELLVASGNGHQFRLRLAREVGQLDFVNFVAAARLDRGMVAVGNVALRPQSAWIAEGRWEWSARRRASVALTISHAWLSDIVDRVPIRSAGATFDAPGNIGEGMRDQASLTATLPLGALGLRDAEIKVDGSYHRSRVMDPTDGSRRSISGEKPYALTTSFHQNLPRRKAAWGVALDAGWRTRSFFYNEIDVTSRTAQVSAFFDWNPRPDWSWHFEVSDAWGRRDRRVIDSYAGERGTAPLLFRDERSLSVGPAFLIRSRKQF